MTASAPPAKPECVSKSSECMMNTTNSTTSNCIHPLPKSKVKKIFTVGYFHASMPAVPSEVVSTKILRENSTEATTQHCNDLRRSPSKKFIRAPQSPSQLKNIMPSPQSVVSSHITISNIDSHTTSTDINTDSTSSHCKMQSHESSAAQHAGGAPSTCSHKIKMERNYDMNLVPMLIRNPLFLRNWRKITLAGVKLEGKSIDSTYASASASASGHKISSSRSHSNSFEHISSAASLPSLLHCDESCDDSEPDTVSEGAAHCDSSSSSASTNDKDADVDTDTDTHSGPCHICIPQTKAGKIPFGLNSQSVIWAPKSRFDWEDSIDEMVAVCTAAAWHKHISLPHKIRRKAEFNTPISRIYIQDRIQIDDPLRGYQIRHKAGGWLQGFVMMTNFTTWTHYFKWDSHHSANGIDHKKCQGLNDDGIFAKELEGQVRSGDPLAEGVVWPTIAEISLVGALGCGEYLLQMALDDISRRGCYEYAVLEATETSRPFYEKFGFVRVGAVCKYGNEKDVKDANGEVQDVGYRHWSYAQTTEEGLNQIGAPSCMMARRIKKFNPYSICNCCAEQGTPSFVDQLGVYFVHEKPRIAPLGQPPRKRSMSCASASGTKATKKAKTSHPAAAPTEAPVPVSITLSGRQSKAPDRLEEVGAKTIKKRSPSICLELKPTKKVHKNVLLRKQIIPTGYRCPKKEYYYNKVVTPKSNKKSYKSKYYFVINYDVNKSTIRLIPLFVNGVFKGKREGKPKWKANVLPRENEYEEIYLKSMDVITSSVSEWEVARAFAVTKCVSVQGESWDIEDV